MKGFPHTDTGIGMDKEQTDSLFIPFASTKGVKRGLGLYVSKRIVESLGGYLKLNFSSRSEGTQFEFTLPFKGTNTVTRPQGMFSQLEFGDSKRPKAQAVWGSRTASSAR